jgi:hypothetical protein
VTFSFSWTVIFRRTGMRSAVFSDSDRPWVGWFPPLGPFRREEANAESPLCENGLFAGVLASPMVRLMQCREGGALASRSATHEAPHSRAEWSYTYGMTETVEDIKQLVAALHRLYESGTLSGEECYLTFNVTPAEYDLIEGPEDEPDDDIPGMRSKTAYKVPADAIPRLIDVSIVTGDPTRVAMLTKG